MYRNSFFIDFFGFPSTYFKHFIHESQTERPGETDLHSIADGGQRASQCCGINTKPEIGTDKLPPRPRLQSIVAIHELASLSSSRIGTATAIVSGDWSRSLNGHEE